jgi:hypothetical protein
MFITHQLHDSKKIHQLQPLKRKVNVYRIFPEITDREGTVLKVKADNIQDTQPTNSVKSMRHRVTTVAVEKQ